MSEWRDAVAALIAKPGELVRNLSGADPEKTCRNSRGNAGHSPSQRIDPVFPVVPGVDRVNDLTIYLSPPQAAQNSGNSTQEDTEDRVVALVPGTTGLTESIPAGSVDACELLIARWRRGHAALCASLPPEGWSTTRWHDLKNEVDSFIDDWGMRAAQLGWDGLDLFGVDIAKSYTRIDRMGLVPLLHGKLIIELSHDAAALRTRSGALQKFRRSRRPDCRQHRVELWSVDRAADLGDAVDTMKREHADDQQRRPQSEARAAADARARARKTVF